MKNLNSVSIIIPVYNEADYLGACLDAIAAQTIKPLEVIVVDNNSSDSSARIARSYDFVTVIREPKQGVVHARDTGFNAAKGAILGRIDADTILASNWVEKVQTIFTDPTISSVSGEAKYYDIAWSTVVDACDSTIRRATARTFGDKVALQGANMALRRSIWLQIRDSVCHEGNMHEDFDLAVHIYDHGYKNAFDPNLLVAISYRHAAYSFKDFMKYALLSPRTYLVHGYDIGLIFYPMIACIAPCYPALQILSRGYDRQTKKFSPALLLETPNRRVNPATYGDY